MQAIKAILKQKLGIEPGECPHCGSDEISTFIIYPSGAAFPKPTFDFVNRPPPQNKLPNVAQP